MTFKGSTTTTTAACAACKHQRKRCTPECALAPHFRPEQPTLFKNAHKLFGVKNLLRILQQIHPNHKSDAMRSLIYEANMRDLFPVHGCLTVIYDLQYQILQAEEELCNILGRLDFFKQHHERQQSTILSIADNHEICINSLWVQETNNKCHDDSHNKPLLLQPLTIEEEAMHGNEESFPMFDAMEDRVSYID